jgi:transcriptional regulator with XRE-family HTH domain
MYGNPQRLAAVQVQELRREGGRWLKERRENVGLSQRQLAELVGAEYYTFISQLETGRGRIPPDRYRLWAQALRMPPKEFVRNILRFYDPVTFGILFDGD